MLPGVRNSRLRNRLKEERELLVKKAFIEDLLKENHLLNTLIGKGSAFRAVLWHPDSLPSLAKVSQAGTILDDVLVKDAELSVTPSKGVNDDMHHSNSDKNTLNDLDNTDILCDFQVDTGTLVCVTCGILGYPIMSVVQPSKRASMKYFSAEKMSQSGVVDTSRLPDSHHIQCSAKISFPETTIDETWDTSAFFRPQIFCLEHAVQIEELLRPKGGAKMLVICHSDYKKIKANAAAVAEELRTTFNYKEVCFGSASQEELSLIEMAIDDEPLTDFQEDWTSELGINLRFSVKTRKGCLPKKIEHGLNVDYLLSLMPPISRIANIKWCCRKSRTKRLPNHRTLATYCDGNFSKKGEVSHVSDSMKVKAKVLLQYYRRNYRTKSSNSSGEKYASECSMACSTEVTNDDYKQSNDHNEQDTLGTCFRIAETVAEEDSLDEHFVVYEEFEALEANSEPASNTSSEMVITEAFTLTSSASNLLRTAGVVEDPNNANEDLNIEICYGSPASAVPDGGKSSSAGKDMDVENGCTARGSVHTLMCRPEELNDEQAGGSSTSDHAFRTAYTSEVSGSSVPENSNKREVYDNAGFYKMENLGDSETYKHDTTAKEVDMCNLPKESLNDSYQSVRASSLSSKNKRLANAKRPCRDKNKGRIKLQTEAQNSYIRSPCEGLRPRKNKVDSFHTLEGNVSEKVEEKPLTKKLKKSSGSSASCNQGLINKTSYKCNVEGCRLFFQTKVQLSLHKNNKCHHKKCGKKFRAHKYVVLHQRVHDDERPLKCTWAGCTMTFKWTWARTEHLRLHTGERPYQCKIKGCGLTFRFVSDFSRHRRKFGHYVAPK